MTQRRLSSLTRIAYETVAARNPVVIVPAGSIEQHGPHLPLSTDATLGVELGRRIAEAIDGVMAEPLIYGCRSDVFSGGGESFAGTQSLRHETFLAVACEVVAELLADGFRRILLLNAHYENAPMLREAARRSTAAFPDARILLTSWWDAPRRGDVIALFPNEFPGMDLEHAGLLETSMMLHVAPELVGPRETFPDVLASPPGYELYPESLQRAAVGSGSLAPATAASAETGARLARMVIESVSAAVRATLGVEG